MDDNEIKENLIKKNNFFSNLIFQIGVPFLILFISSILILYILSLYLHNLSYDYTVRNSMNMFQTLSHDINKEVDNIVADGALISTLVGSYEEGEAKKVTSSVVGAHPQLLKVAFYGLDKKLVWDISSTPGESIKTKSSISSITPSIRRENTYFSEKNVYLHVVEYPINIDNKLGGILEITYDTSRLWELLASSDVKNIYITDKQGNILLSKMMVPAEAKTIEKSIFGKYSSNWGSVISYKDVEGETVFGVASQIKSLEWTLIFEDLIDKKMRTTNTLITTSIIFAMFLLMLFIFDIYIIYKKIISPLNRLKNITSILASGSFDVIQNKRENNQFDTILDYINNTALSMGMLKNDFNNQIEVRTSQLQKSVKEAESMSSLMVNRELKMVELKKQNEELKIKLEKLKQTNREEGK